MRSDLSLLDLLCLDLLSWLGSGSQAAEMLHLSASSVSRRSRDCAEALGISLERGSAGVCLAGNNEGIKAMRTFLRQLRLIGKMPARIESWVDPLALNPKQQGGQSMHFLHRPYEEKDLQRVLESLNREILDFAVVPKTSEVEESLSRSANNQLTATALYNPAPVGNVLLISTLEWIGSKPAERLRTWLLTELKAPRCPLDTKETGMVKTTPSQKRASVLIP